MFKYVTLDPFPGIKFFGVQFHVFCYEKEGSYLYSMSWGVWFTYFTVVPFSSACWTLLYTYMGNSAVADGQFGDGNNMYMYMYSRTCTPHYGNDIPPTHFCWYMCILEC